MNDVGNAVTSTVNMLKNKGLVNASAGWAETLSSVPRDIGTISK